MTLAAEGFSQVQKREELRSKMLEKQQDYDAYVTSYVARHESAVTMDQMVRLMNDLGITNQSDFFDSRKVSEKIVIKCRP